MYNIYKISTDTFKAVEMLAGLVSLEECERLEGELQKRYDVIDYYVAGYEVGSSEDMKSKAEL